MEIFRIRYLLFLNAICFIHACNPYRHMQKMPADPACLYSLKPDFSHVYYKTSVDVLGKHLSGILLFKTMPDSSSRIVFLSETGFVFFDFGLGTDSGFQVHQIMPQMNKSGLVHILCKDFELLLFKNMDRNTAYTLKDSSRFYHAFPQHEETNYYVTDSLCTRLYSLQRAKASRRLMEALIFPAREGDSADSIFLIHHLKINFTISLKKIPGGVAE